MNTEKAIKKRQTNLKKLFLEQLKKTPTIEQSAQKISTTRMTIYRLRKASKQFDFKVEEALREGREFVSDVAETQMFSKIGQVDTSMIRYFLSHNNARYKDKLEISGSINAKDEPLTAAQKKFIKQALNLSSLKEHVKRTRE